MKTSRTAIRFVLLAALTMTLVPASFGQYNILLRVNGISGESTIANHIGDIDAAAFSFGVSMPVTTAVSDSGGALPGRPIFTDLSVTKFVDKASPTLLLDSATGASISAITLFVQTTSPLAASSPVAVDYYKVKLSGVIITSISTSGTVNGRPTETLTLKYSQIKIEYTPINPDGTLGATITTSINAL